MLIKRVKLVKNARIKKASQFWGIFIRGGETGSMYVQSTLVRAVAIAIACMSRKGPKVSQGKLDFVEDCCLGVKSH